MSRMCPSFVSLCSISMGPGLAAGTTCQLLPSSSGLTVPMCPSYKLSHVRFVLVKYSHRGLVNDRYYYNMNMKLFKYLFWISNISAVAVNQGNMWSFSIKHGYSLVTNTYRFSTYALTILNLIIE